MGPFDWWDKNGKLEFQQGDVRIYNVNQEQYLFIGQTLFASTVERLWYIKNVMPHARGRCLEIGLGLGVASKAILSHSRVTQLLTVEKNEDVIAAFGRPLPRHLILCTDVNEWVKSVPTAHALYDFIFVDHYVYDEELLPELQELAQRLAVLLKPGGSMVFWIDENAPDPEKEKIRQLYLTKA